MNKPDPRLSMFLAEIGLSQRTIACLEKEGILRVGDLLSQTPTKLLAIKNFGDASLSEVYAALSTIGYHRKTAKPKKGLKPQDTITDPTGWKARKDTLLKQKLQGYAPEYDSKYPKTEPK